MSDQLLDSGPASFWDQMKEAAGLGNSEHTYAKINLMFGFKVFVKASDNLFDADGNPLSQIASFFPYEVGNQKSVEEARRKANKFVLTNGLTSNPSNLFCMVVYPKTCLNKDLSSWKDDRAFFYFPRSGPAKDPERMPMSWFYEQYIETNLRNSGITQLGEYWAELAWAADKGAKQRQRVDAERNPVFDEDGQPVMQDQLSMYPVRIFKSREEALEACGADDAEDHEDGDAKTSVVPPPAGYDEETWATTVEDIKAEGKKGRKAVAIAKDYDLPVETIKAILS